ncbi:MAG: 5-oxoprolinase subunit PxpA [Rhodospirillales bacterium]|jgi:UPF0271 protein|nr:5-oxoprolinase subunit PxpA [Rhodospirillales bacterium]
MLRVDLNSDMGESFGAYSMGDDASMLKIVSSANIACGFHGGDPLVMHRTLSCAKENGVGAGAHPSFIDAWGFGRRPILGERPEDIEKILVYQIGALVAMASHVGHAVTHLKPHGSLNNMACVDADLAMACARAARTSDWNLILVAMPGTEMEKAGEKLGLRVAREIFADRAYTDEGHLVSRKKEGSMIHDPEVAARRVVRMVEDQEIVSITGKRVPVRVDTVCVHGDNPAAVATANLIRESLTAAGVAIAPMAEIIG